ncbi:MAG TPA: Rieske (2Fe-2S) protein, partial [Chthoniobacterales bacterium]|nr:Rieske (2Fe-2S) protein [Chthoniobacterales bacterium]
IFELEKGKVFHHSWQYVGHVSMLREPGSYISRNILDQNVLILRDRDREVRAFFNVCQHRAHQLLKGEGRLTAATITCPYHAWIYDLAGRLRSARGAEKLADFDAQSIRLSPVRLASFLGSCSSIWTARHRSSRRSRARSRPRSGASRLMPRISIAPIAPSTR